MHIARGKLRIPINRAFVSARGLARSAIFLLIACRDDFNIDFEACLVCVFDHVFGAGARWMHKCNQCFGMLGHYAIAYRAGSASVAIPFSREAFDGQVMLKSIAFA